MRTLLFTTGSPFARGVRVILDELGLGYERREEIATPTVEERSNSSPTLQVPTLWDGETTLWESGLIADYLLSKYPERPDARPPLVASIARNDNEWTDKLILATVQTLGTTATIISQMKWSGVGYSNNEFLTRSAKRLPYLIKWLEDHLENEQQGFIEGGMSVQDIFLTCHLGFIANRPIGLDPQLGKYPKVNAMVGRLEERASFQDNPILWWEPGVTGYAGDGKTPVFER
ncbi:MAG: glutathione S-transferase family protein [Alphaproteobacteria bacterium]